MIAVSTFMKAHSAKAPRTHFDPRNEFAMGRRDTKIRAPGDDGAAFNRALGLDKSGKTGTRTTLSISTSAKASPSVSATTSIATSLAPELSATVNAPLSDAISAP